MKATDLVKNNSYPQGATNKNGDVITYITTDLALTAVNHAGIEMRDRAINAYIRMFPSATPEQLNQFSRMLNEENLALKEELYDVIDTSLTGYSDEYYRFQGSHEECLAYIKEHENESNLCTIP